MTEMHVEELEPNAFGRRLREIRVWRGMNQTTLAQLAGFQTHSSVSRLESGDTAVPSREVLENLFTALKVSPEEFGGLPWERRADSAAHATVAAIELALDSYELGVDPGVPVREWGEVQADVDTLVELQHLTADYAAQGELAPRLLAELHAVYVRQPEHRQDALIGLIVAYSSAVWVTKRLGGRGWSVMAAKVAEECAAELGMPQWSGYAAWLRGDASGSMSRQARQTQYQRAVAAADELTGQLDDKEVIQAYGMLHLSASLAAAAQGDQDTAMTHIDEAGSVADRMDYEVGAFARLWFGRANVGVWKTTIGLEFGQDAGKVSEIARGVHVEAIPSKARQAEFYADWGRALLGDKGQRDRGLGLILRAEELAPQRIQNDLLIREAVAGQLRSARRDAGGRELRGLAYRMRIAPTGAPTG